MAGGAQEEPTTGARVFAALVLLGLFGGGWWWVNDLLTCDPPKPVPPVPGQVICQRLTTCSIKQVSVDTCLGWTHGTRCSAEVLAALDGLASCEELLASPLRGHNGCINW
jgi:hypothetical protein